ncbi:terC [Symbiodinium microadriaticum]|nr:terC [Symbiodinium sp. KB8]CAE7761646.1 terC [Symbiodinium microadriaticum]
MGRASSLLQGRLPWGKKVWGVTCLKKADIFCWTLLGLTLVVALALDVSFSPPRVGALSVQTAGKLTAFWFCVGLLFDVFLLGHSGWEASSGFMQGFLLEYMLSFDNLFVFHLVFSYYCTPEDLMYRALYFGIAGAIVLRVVFLSVGYTVLNRLALVKIIFGVVLVYSGLKTAADVEEETDPSKNQLVALAAKVLPISDHYEPHGHFFFVDEETVRDDMSDRGRSPSLEGLLATDTDAAFNSLPRLESFEGSSLLRAPEDRGRPSNPREGSELFRAPRARQKASLLLLVVIALLAVDLIFAIDSVASKLAAVNDVFLNCASSAFAMMGLRSLYFIMESLVQTFYMLKYGIAAVLVLIGLKLLFSQWLDISNTAMFVMIIVICAASAASSYWVEQVPDACKGANGLESEEDMERTDRHFDREAIDSPAGQTMLEERAALEPVTPSRPVPLRVQAEECEPLKFERYELQPVTSSPDQGRWTEHEDVGETPSRRDEMRSLAASTGSSGDHGGEKSEEDPDEEHPTQTDEGQALGTQRLGHCGPEGLHIENADAGVTGAASAEDGERLHLTTLSSCNV